MSRAPVTAALAAAALAASPACGGEPAEPPATVLLVAVDDLRADRFEDLERLAAVAPTLARLAREGTLWTDAITASTATAPAIASLLSGVDPVRHGLRSARDPLLGRLGQPQVAGGRVWCGPPDVWQGRTSAEELASRGWRTIGAVALPWLSTELSGLDRGFERWVDEDLPATGPPRSARETLERLGPDLEALLESDDPVFAFVHLADLREEARPPPARLAELLAERLAPFRAEVPGLADALDAPREGAGERVARVGAVVSRRRGRPEWVAWREALYDAGLAAVDAAVAELIDGLRRSERLAHAHVFVVGTRGAYLTEDRPDGELEGFSEGLVRVPLLGHGPGIGPGRRAEVVPATCLHEAVLDPSAASGDLWTIPIGEPFAWTVVESPALDAFALVGQDWKAIRAAERVLVVRRRDDAAPATGEEIPAEAAAVADLARSRLPLDGASLHVLFSPSSHEAELVSELVSPAARIVTAAPAKLEEHGVEGEISREGDRRVRLALKGSSAGRLDARLTRPCAPFLLALSVDGEAPPEEELDLDRLPLFWLPRLPDPRAAAWEAPDDGPAPWTVDVRRAEGAWFAVEIEGAPDTAVRVLAVGYPPGGPAAVDSLSAEAPGARVRRLLDGAEIEGELPLALRIAPGPGRRFALSVELAGEDVPAARMRYLGRRAADGELRLFVPRWAPLCSRSSPGQTGRPPQPPQQAQQASESGAAVRIDLLRFGTGAPGDLPEITDDELRLRARLGRNE